MPNYVGQRKKVTITLEVNDVAADGTVAAYLMDPVGNVTTPSVTDETGTGNYSTMFTLTREGRWWLRVASTGSVIAAQEVALDVEASPFVDPN
jgi:hypothetical protein